MELKDFIKNSLLDVMRAVQEAQKEWQESGHMGAINPVWATVDKESFRDISFDVAVTAENATAGKVGGGIHVVGIKVGGDTSETVSSSSVSRLQFSVPIVPPAITVVPQYQRSGPIDYRPRGVV
jgi:hypothetical protein